MITVNNAQLRIRRRSSLVCTTIQGIHGTEDASEELESVLTPAQLKKLDLTGNVPAQLMTEITRGLDRMNEHKVSFF